MSAMFAVYHGPHGLKDIATRVHEATLLLAAGNQGLCDLLYQFFERIIPKGARKAGHEVMNPHFFDTIRLSLDCDMSVVQQRARQKRINLRYHTDHTVIRIHRL
jgi:glycine dehydrogenase